MKACDQFTERAAILKALAHPSRLMMVDELSRGERCVCELTDLVGADISTVSKHLSLLKDAGIVDCSRDGVKVFYRLRVPCVINFFACIEAVCEENARCGLRNRES
ncbi:MAG: winged helix-turn-helix transcriptional regulator [Candidatus Brocadiaceae bacterium]|nr:winged helix-turn-helix transcriptional regulator [Candidatus Brocadiaceae bacterium]